MLRLMRYGNRLWARLDALRESSLVAHCASVYIRRNLVPNGVLFLTRLSRRQMISTA